MVLGAKSSKVKKTNGINNSLQENTLQGWAWLETGPWISHLKVIFSKANEVFQELPFVEGSSCSAALSHLARGERLSFLGLFPRSLTSARCLFSIPRQVKLLFQTWVSASLEVCFPASLLLPVISRIKWHTSFILLVGCFFCFFNATLEMTLKGLT